MSTLPAFATTEELATRIPGGISNSDLERAQAALDDAAALMWFIAGTNTGWLDDNDVLLDTVPDVLRTINLAAARRVMENPGGATQESETVGSYSHSETFGDGSNDVYLKTWEKAAIRRATGKSPIGTISTTRGDLETGPLYCNNAPPEREHPDAASLVNVAGGEPAVYMPADDEWR